MSAISAICAAGGPGILLFWIRTEENGMSSQFLNFSIKARGEGNLDPEDDDNYCDIPDIGPVQLLFRQCCVDFKSIVAPRVYPSVPRIDGASGNSHLLFETLVTVG